VQHHQLDAVVRAGPPSFVLGQCDIRKHDFIQADCVRIASAESKVFVAIPDHFTFFPLFCRETDLILSVQFCILPAL
jgi:hypothetical protein